MQSANKKQIARLAALTLIFSYIELMLPRIIPFFRLGLGNAALLLGLNLTFPSYILLSIIKAVTSNLMSGTLITPFFLISLAQNIMSALVMYLLFHLNNLPLFRKKLLSLYGISLTGSAISALVQIFLSSLYLGSGTIKLLGPMLLFNTISGIITAWLAEYIGGESLPLARIRKLRLRLLTTPSAGGSAPRNAPQPGSHSEARTILLTLFLLISATAVFFIKRTSLLCLALLLSLAAQKLCKRKILIWPHISIWIFVILTSLLLPNGKVLCKILGYSITQGALFSGIQKALRLSTVSALSQCAVILKPKENSLLALTLDYYTSLMHAISIQEDSEPQSQTEE